MSESTAPRKRLRVGHASERGAVNAVRTLLERHNLIVAEVDGRADYGRDLMVDVTDDGEITGAVVGVQVKGDQRYVRASGWTLPATPKDRRYWADSSVPIMGVLHDPATGEMRWTNLTEFARRPPAPSLDVLAVVDVPVDQPLDDSTLLEFVHHAQTYVRQASPTGLLDLFSDDDQHRCLAVDDCFALGRGDARALILLRRALPGLDGYSFMRALVALSHATDHPDIFWSKKNWIPRAIEDQARATFRWSASELYLLVAAVEARAREGDLSWERGGLGQCLWHLLAPDPGLRRRAEDAIGLALDDGDLDAAFRLLVIAQYRASDADREVTDLLGRYPNLLSHELMAYFADEVQRVGAIPVY